MNKIKIINAAAKLLVLKGKDSVTIRDICKECKIKAPTVYYYFADRNKLFEEVTRFAFSKGLNFLKRKTSPINYSPAQVKQQLSSDWDAYVSFVLKSPDLSHVMIQSVISGQIPEIGKFCFATTATLFEVSQNLKLIRYSARESAIIFQSAAQGIATIALAYPRQVQEEQAHQEFIIKISSSVKSMIFDKLFL